jgi:CheY-like chemotaxis protein
LAEQGGVRSLDKVGGIPRRPQGCGPEQAAAGWRDIPVIVITSLDPDAKDRARLNSGMQSMLVKERFRPADLVERIRRLVHKKPEVISGMEAAS